MAVMGSGTDNPGKETHGDTGRIPTLVCAGLEHSINRILDLDPVARQGFASLYGKAIRLDILGPGFSIYLIPGRERVQILSRYEDEPDCGIQGSPLALLQMRNRRLSSGRLSTGEVRITGDTEVAHRLGRIVSSLDIDWEEQLSRFTGDLLAHRLGRLVRQASDWGDEGANTLTANMGEYLQEELRLLPGRLEIGEFLSDVDTLRDDTERLQQRIRRLADMLEGTP